MRALIAILDAVFAARDWAEWRRVLESAGIAFGVVGTLDDIPHDAQMRDSGALVPFDDPRGGATLTVSSPVWMEGQDKVPPTLAPEIGEHSVASPARCRLRRGRDRPLTAGRRRSPGRGVTRRRYDQSLIAAFLVLPDHPKP